MFSQPGLNRLFMSKHYNTYDELRQSNLSTSLLLFLLLNIAFSLFYVMSAITNSRHPPAAAIIVAGLSLTVLVISLFRMSNYAVSLNCLAIIIGLS
ncbi:hypothetical protein D8L93_07835 [Sodalis-like symbiont of Bactericera trigonica]|nr:hypothetical protein D8L93_07835 [Sodalis-like symbiont of Bactericera trigonica]